MKSVFGGLLLLSAPLVSTASPGLNGVLLTLDPAKVSCQVDVKNGYSYADPTLYASGGYVLDPYYN